MRKSKKTSSLIEILESRIAPAVVPILQATWLAANAGASTGTGQSTFELHAGQGLSSSGAGQGTYFLYVEQGSAIVFATDSNGNGIVDASEFTGVSAGDGLRLISFVDIHGDIVTNLKETTVFEAGAGGTVSSRSVLTLSDSDNNATNDLEADGRYRGDGRVVLNNTIEKIELRSLTAADLPEGSDVAARAPSSNHSIFGTIYAGRGFGGPPAPDGTPSGLIVESPAAGAVAPFVNGIKVGTAVAGGYYSFGPSNQNDFQGELLPFTPPSGAKGGSIDGVKASGLNINSLIAGNGGTGGDGGDVMNVNLDGVISGNCVVIAGNGGRGPSGGNGGSILNFTSTDSVTGQMLIKTGTGGFGTNGPGGASGNLAVGTLTVGGVVSVDLGDGGDGFTSGGAGASLAAGKFTIPDIGETQGLAAVGVTNLADSRGTYVPRIGSHTAVDFNGDGFGDIVFTTGISLVGLTDPTSTAGSHSQLIVMLGDGKGGYLPFTGVNSDLSSRGVYLPGLPNSGALAVADFNGDGHPDIAVASTDDGQPAGVVTYFSKFVAGGFVGFGDGRFSPLDKPGAVFKLVAGDFNGDGKVELAVLQDGRVGFMQQDYENGKPTGQFYFDMGTKGDPTATPAILPMKLDPFVPIGSKTGNIRVTALADGTNGSTASTHDVVLVLDTDGTIKTVDYSVRSIPNPLDPSGPSLPVQPKLIGAFAAASLMEDFSVTDFNADGKADVGATAVFLSLVPDWRTVFIGFLGDGAGSGSELFFGFDGRLTIDSPGPKPGAAITSGDFTHDGVTDDFGVAFSVTGAVQHYHIANIDPIGLTADLNRVTMEEPVTPLVSTGDQFGPWMPYTTFIAKADDVTTSTSGFGGGAGIEFPIPALSPLVAPPLGIVKTIPYTKDRFFYKAGDGGNSLVGSGGNGGFFGGKLNATSDGVTATTDADLQFDTGEVPVTLTAGKGGNGFASGGKGGTISGVSFTGTTTVPDPDDAASKLPPPGLFAGDGGRGVTGVGGAGGDIFDIKVDNVEKLIAGAGGVGKVGGNGGNIGRALAPGEVPLIGLYNAAASKLSLQAGAGGNGTTAGGAGGSILNFVPTFPAGGTALSYVSGDGGDATSGRGGTGGSVTSSSPLKDNSLAGDILIQSGNGGDGLTGGAGGSIVDFVDRPVAGVDRVRIVSFLCGSGGNGRAGVGGNGGGISNVSVPTSGILPPPDPDPTVPLPPPLLTPYVFDRMIAGNGGNSSSSTGGKGGSIQNVLTAAQVASFAVIAGAGGDGVSHGGKGGSLLSVEVSIGAGPFAHALLIAGAGGNASAFVPNPNDTSPDQARKAFGGTVGVGGDGGDINGVTQRGASQAHMNLIGGNGGDTTHYGTVYDPKPFVGRGGSVSNVDIIGDIGNTTPDNPGITGNQAVPIKSYNDILHGQLLAQWVDAKLVNNVFATDKDPVTLDDTDGNVGLVVGAAGRNKPVVIDPVNLPGVYRSQPATGGLNGDVINLIARNLMSAVAGSVDRIASIHLAKGIKVLPGIIGSEKGEIGAKTPNYLDQFGNPTEKNGDVSQGEPEIDGRLIDGALIAKTTLDLNGTPVTLPGKVFPR